MFAPSLESSDIPGVSHCDELFFLWNPYYNVSYPLQGEDRKVEENKEIEERQQLEEKTI